MGFCLYISLSNVSQSLGTKGNKKYSILFFLFDFIFIFVRIRVHIIK